MFPEVYQRWMQEALKVATSRGSGRDDVHKSYFEARHVDTLDFLAKACRDDMTFTGGVLRDECARLHRPVMQIYPQMTRKIREQKISL